RIPVCSLSLHCPVDPRHLHSFPTRRSSDLVAFCQAVATITFMTVTNNRIITPSIMGFESLYTVIQTGAVYAFGVAGAVALQGTSQFLLQVAAQVGLSGLLYGWLLRGKYAEIQVMVPGGSSIGGGRGAASRVMQRQA